MIVHVLHRLHCRGCRVGVLFRAAATVVAAACAIPALFGVIF